MLPEPLVLALFAAFFVLVLLDVFWLRQLERLLGERHPEVLDKLEARDERKDEEAGTSLQRFIWRRSYRSLRDPEVSRMAGRLFGLQIAIIAVFAPMFLNGFYETYAETDAPPHAEASGEDWQGKRMRAFALHNQGQIEDAIRLYDELLGPVGADGELVYWRGVAHWKAGREDMALVDFRRVMDLNPGWFDTYLHADRILSKQRRFDDCVDLWTRYLRAVPGDATAYLERGGSHFHRGDFAAAHADLKRACETGKKEACDFAERARARM